MDVIDGIVSNQNN